MFKSAFAVFLASCAVHVALSQNAFAQNKVTPDKEASIKADLAGQIDGMKKQAQVMVDSVFSFGELGMQEFETSKYLSGILEKEGFRIQRGVAGIPTAWVAEWGSGKPVISLGSDIDDIPQASQKPGVGYHDPMIEGAPGHGEGHNSGVPLNIVAALAAGAPWRGRSALDAVELMDVGWNFRREHLRLATRLHYVITNGGDQPNVVPPTASVWYYYREADYDHIMNLWRIGDNMAKAATLMTDTTFTSRLLGQAWPGHFNRAIAEDMYANIQKVGLPTWSDADQALAKGLQKELGVKENGLPSKIPPLRAPRPAPAAGEDEMGPGAQQPTGGGSDDIGDISWNVPTVVLMFPSNIPGGPGHNWANGVSMATPIAHKGVVAGAKVLSSS